MARRRGTRIKKLIPGNAAMIVTVKDKDYFSVNDKYADAHLLFTLKSLKLLKFRLTDKDHHINRIVNKMFDPSANIVMIAFESQLNRKHFKTSSGIHEVDLREAFMEYFNEVILNPYKNLKIPKIKFV